MRGSPSSAHRPIRPARFPIPKIPHGICHRPNVRIVVAHPARHVVKSLRRHATRLFKVLEKTQKRLMHLGEVGVFGQPVILLRIDVHRIITTPRRLDVWIP